MINPERHFKVYTKVLTFPFLFKSVGIYVTPNSDDIPDVASWVIPHCEAPRFPGPLLIRTRCPDTSPNSSL